MPWLRASSSQASGTATSPTCSGTARTTARSSRRTCSVETTGLRRQGRAFLVEDHGLLSVEGRRLPARQPTRSSPAQSPARTRGPASESPPREEPRVVAKPVKHGDKWRIRWLDERGERQSAVHDDYKVAQSALREGGLHRDARCRGAGGGRVARHRFRSAAHHCAAQLRRADEVRPGAVRPHPRPSPASPSCLAPASSGAAGLHQPEGDDVPVVVAHLPGGAAHRVLLAAEFPKVERNGKERPYVRFHDLRHTFASHWAMRGGDLFKLRRSLAISPCR
jgi:hypothetical protein